jgi:hypothetical protein
MEREDLARQLARATESFQSITDYFKTPEYSKFKLPEMVPVAEQQANNFLEGIEVEVKFLQDHLAPDEELWMYYTNGFEFVRVLEITLPSTNVVVMSGHDQDGNDVRVLAHINAVQFTCKVVRVQPDEKPKRIGFSVSV